MNTLYMISSLVGGFYFFYNATPYIFSGSAPLAPKTHEFVRVCLDTTLMQGYRLTEHGKSCIGILGKILSQVVPFVL